MEPERVISNAMSDLSERLQFIILKFNLYCTSLVTNQLCNASYPIKNTWSLRETWASESRNTIWDERHLLNRLFKRLCDHQLQFKAVLSLMLISAQHFSYHYSTAQQYHTIVSPAIITYLSEPLHAHSNLSNIQSFSYSEHNLLRRYSCTWYVSMGLVSMCRSHTFTER